MSFEQYDDNCRGCKPALINAQTGQVLPDDDPKMQVILELFERLTLNERRAWHRFTCKNSRDPSDLKVVAMFQDRITTALGGK